MSNKKISELSQILGENVVKSTDMLALYDASAAQTKKISVGELQTIVALIRGTNYILIKAQGTDTENAAELQAAYNTAKTMSPSATNRITIVASPGKYSFSSDFTMDTQYIDLVSMDGNRSIVFNGTGTISITANDVFVKGVDVGTKSFTIATSLGLLKIENCKGGDYSFGFSSSASIVVSGTFVNCDAGDYSFGCAQNAFLVQANASGVFTNCSAGNTSFGANNSGDAIASGTFTNCSAGENSFGVDTFFGYGSASGIFTNCTASQYSFGAYGGITLGTFYECSGGDEVFGTAGGCDGVFYRCIGGNKSFGNNNGLTGFLLGKLYWCKKTAGTFQTVSGSGQTRMCLDGTNVENNQG